MKVTATVQFMPMKAAADYIHVSIWWLRNSAPKNFPRRIALSTRKVGYWKHELDAWLVKIARQRGRSQKSAA